MQTALFNNSLIWINYDLQTYASQQKNHMQQIDTKQWSKAHCLKHSHTAN